jgi:hypothetical protein
MTPQEFYTPTDRGLEAQIRGLGACDCATGRRAAKSRIEIAQLSATDGTHPA